MGDALRLPETFLADGLVLRPATTEDVDRITAICQDPEIQRFTRIPVPYGRQDAVGFVAMATEALQEGRGAHLLVEVDGAVVGCVGADIDPVYQVAVVGYWTAPEARRQGITTTAIRHLCRWLLDEVGMARLELDAAATNPGSNAVAERLGFKRDGTRRSGMLLAAVGDRGAERVDATVWGLLPDELR